MARLLITGGAGYVGSHCVKALAVAGHECVVYDNLSRGHREFVKWGPLIEGDMHDAGRLAQVFASHAFDAVLHFAALAYVGESVDHPRNYYRNNVLGTLNLLDAMLDSGVKKIVFSSTCSTYGVPETESISESHPQRPVNPYGRTKLTIEQALADYALAYGLQSVSLRYFNAAGCDPEGELGERHDPETHLIPLVLREALRVKRGGDPGATELHVNGEDFDTPDGTCVRDYIHVQDLGRAHLIATHRLVEGQVKGAEAYNLGIERGFSVKDVIETCRAVTGTDIRYRVAERRPGDPPRLVANAAKARDVLRWRPEFTHLASIVETAWRYVEAQPV